MESPAALNSTAGPLASAPERQAFLLLRTVFTVAPVIFGLDKFTNLLTDWTMYLAPGRARMLCRSRRRPSCTSSAWWRSPPAWRWR